MIITRRIRGVREGGHKAKNKIKDKRWERRDTEKVGERGRQSEKGREKTREGEIKKLRKNSGRKE